MRYCGHVPSQVTSIALSSDGEYFVSGDQGAVHVVALETGSFVACLQVKHVRVTSDNFFLTTLQDKKTTHHKLQVILHTNA